MMLHLGENRSQIEAEMDSITSVELRRSKLTPLRATSRPGQKDYLEKIIALIRGCGFGVAIFSKVTPASTLANIFFEVALCNLFGKPVILVKSKNAKAPSDFVRTEWITYVDGQSSGLKKDFAKSVQSVLQLATFYDKLGDLALEAPESDLELAFERFKQAYLVDGKVQTKRKIQKLLRKMQFAEDASTGLTATRARIQQSIAEFCKFLQ